VSGPLLMHSLTEFGEIIFRCLDVVAPRSLVEVGAEDGTFTVELLRWAGDHDATVHAVEPFPTPAIMELAERWPQLHLMEERSPGALEKLESADVYLVDGDHNYVTVRAELDAIFGAGGERSPLAFFHDVEWPSGRRDMYYDPDGLPPEAVHPHTYHKGVVPGCGGVVEGGFRGAGAFAWARHEGGPANGVRTAVEDFLVAHDGELRFVTVPCVFGLGVVYPASAPWATSVDEVLAPYADNPLLARLEENRLSLYLTVIELQDHLARTSQLLEQARLERRDVDAENRALWARTAELEELLAELEELLAEQVGSLEARLKMLRGEVEQLVQSRALAVAEGVSRVRQVAAGRGGRPLSRKRLRELLEATSAS
jgi:hypothetical protein